MLSPGEAYEEDDSWEVRAFAEDTNSICGITWPPRSYTCTFCRREFRSAQALGGHMNVHRRDRARLPQRQPQPQARPSSITPTFPSTSASASLIPSRECFPNGGLCFLYQLPNPAETDAITRTLNLGLNPPSFLFPISSHLPDDLISPCLKAGVSSNNNTCQCYSGKSKTLGFIENENSENSNHRDTESAMEELDLELRLGHRPTPP